MRKVLLRFVFDNAWQWQSVGNELLVGVGWLILLWQLICIVAFLTMYLRTKNAAESTMSAAFWQIIPAALGFLLFAQPPIGLVKSGLPVFGYGFMMFLGFGSASWLASRRIRSIGQAPDVIWDMMMWALIPGLIGARLYYLLEYGAQVYGRAPTLRDKLLATVALWDGGIVFYGSVAGGIIGILIFCRRRGISPIAMFDVLAPSLFIGEGFGRIGCFLYGCCFGKACHLPWAVKFPPDSLTFEKLVEWRIINPDADTTIPLHPTQLYSSGMAFLLAGILAWFYRRRPFDGSVMCLAWILYPINRYILETFRGDVAPGNVGLKKAQVISIILVVTGMVAMYYFSTHRKLTKKTDDNASAGIS